MKIRRLTPVWALAIALLCLLPIARAQGDAPPIPLKMAAKAMQSGTCPGGSVLLTTGANWQNTINANAAGTVYCLEEGTFSNWSVTPKSGDSYIARTRGQSILDGNNTTAQAFISTFAPQSSSNRINVTIDGLVFQRYRLSQPNPNAKNTGVIDAGSGWQIRYITMRNNDSGLVFGKENWVCSQGISVTNSRFENNAWRALSWNGSQGTFTNNVFVNNGWSAPVVNNTDFGRWDGALKIQNQGAWNSSFSAFIACPEVANGVYIAYNTSVFNRPMGWWHDINVHNFVFEYNYIAFNDWAGIGHEISGNGIIRNNTFLCNRSRMDIGSGGWGGADIWLISSSNTIIENNTVTVCGSGTSFTIDGVTYTSNRSGHGIMVFAENRGNTHNNVVRNNTVVRQGNIDALTGSFNYSGSFSNNSWTTNTYYTSSASANYWVLNNSFGSFANWQSNSRDTGGSVNTGAPPGQTPTPLPTNTPASAPTATPTPTATPAACSSGAYGGTAAVINSSGGIVEAENFDCGSNDISTGAYYDTTAGNDSGSFVYRTADVDLKTSPYGGYTVGWFTTGEFLTYTLNVQTAGYYDLEIFGGTNDLSQTPSGDKRVRIEIPTGTIRATDITITQTGNWDTYTIIGKNQEAALGALYLAAGTTTMRVYMVEGFADIDRFTFTFSVGATASPTPTLTPSITPTPSATYTPSATLTPSVTPSPAPTNTPTATLDVPAEYLTLEANYGQLAATRAAMQNTRTALEAAQATAAADARTLAQDLIDINLEINEALRDWREFRDRDLP